MFCLVLLQVGDVLSKCSAVVLKAGKVRWQPHRGAGMKPPGSTSDGTGCCWAQALGPWPLLHQHDQQLRGVAVDQGGCFHPVCPLAV